MSNPKVKVLVRTIVYIDGFNLYYGLRQAKWQRYYWLDIRKLATQLLKPDQQLVATKYFTSRIAGSPDKLKRQTTFLDAIVAVGGVEIEYGQYRVDAISCDHCDNKISIPREKMTDVNMATAILTDAFTDKFDHAILVTADSDLIGPVRAVRSNFEKKRIIIAFPPERGSKLLREDANAWIRIGHRLFANSQLPDKITLENGHELCRPEKWA